MTQTTPIKDQFVIQRLAFDIFYQQTKFSNCRFSCFRDRIAGIPELWYGIVCVILHLAILVQFRLVTDRRVDTR